MLNDKVVLITGAGGSIGSELVRSVLTRWKPSKLLLLDICEYNMYKVESVVKETGSNTPVLYLLTDIRHDYLVGHVMGVHRPDVVIHAAALKHVPMLETQHNALEAVRTNILGTETVLKHANNYGVKRFLLVSTDKAVLPVSMMGATKTAAEKVCRAYQYGATKCTMVRFGNVLGSSGSVVPLFEKQIAEGGPVTVTHQDMIRYSMTITEAVDLVLDALERSDAEGESCALYMLDMGEPKKIIDLAHELIQQSGKEIKIEFTGVRSGEKLVEQLHDPETEQPMNRTGKLIQIYQHAPEDIIRNKQALQFIRDAAEERCFETVLAHLTSMVPYSGSEIVCESL